MASFEVIFSDVNLRAGLDPKELVTNAESLNQNIEQIFETPYESKWFRPEIGSNIQKYLFEPIDDITSDRLRSEMQVALNANGEGRMVFTEITVIPDAPNEQYFVRLVYDAPALSARNISFTFNLKRAA